MGAGPLRWVSNEVPRAHRGKRMEFLLPGPGTVPEGVLTSNRKLGFGKSEVRKE